MEWLTTLLPLITTVITKGDNMGYIVAFLLGAVVSGLFTQYILPKIWKPKV